MNPDLQVHLDAIARVGGILWDRGWAEMNAGNISIDVTDCVAASNHVPSADNVIKDVTPHPGCAGRRYLVTAAGSRFREFEDRAREQTMIIAVPDTCDGYVILQHCCEKRRPTSELATHLNVHGYLQVSHRNERVILHTHPTHIIALTHIPCYASARTMSRLLCSMHPEVPMVFPDGIGWVAHDQSGGDRLAAATVDAFKDHSVVIWEKHGCVAVGETLEDAFDRIDIVNKAAQLFFLARNRGKQVEC
jgi:rhamnulose-1-phosphate aldolase